MTKEIETTYLALFSGSWEELSVFDFSLLNLRFLNANSEEFQKIISDNDFGKNRTLNIIKEIIRENGNSDRIQALFPIDFSKKNSKENIFLVWNILLLIFPSDITLHYLLRFQIFKDKVSYYGHTSYPFSPTGYKNLYDNYLQYYEREIESINEFIPIFIERIDKIKYIQSAFHSYLSSFFQNFQSMEFVNLCIALESTVNGNTELNYRIRRNVSILLTSEVEFAKGIFKNIGKIYTLRSKIVHSGNYKPEKINEYLPYLRNVVSRLIVEVISHNIEKLEDLNEILTSKGFGDNKSISENYKEYKLSSKVRSNALAEELK